MHMYTICVCIYDVYVCIYINERGIGIKFYLSPYILISDQHMTTSRTDFLWASTYGNGLSLWRGLIYFQAPMETARTSHFLVHGTAWEFARSTQLADWFHSHSIGDYLDGF